MQQYLVLDDEFDVDYFVVIVFQVEQFGLVWVVGKYFVVYVDDFFCEYVVVVWCCQYLLVDCFEICVDLCVVCVVVGVCQCLVFLYLCGICCIVFVQLIVVKCVEIGDEQFGFVVWLQLQVDVEQCVCVGCCCELGDQVLCKGGVDVCCVFVWIVVQEDQVEI